MSARAAPTPDPESDWTRASDLKAQASRLWARGEIVRATLPMAPDPPEPLFPHRLRLRRPTSRDLATRFEAVRAWVRELEALRHVRIEWRTVRHAELGSNSLPGSIWLDVTEQAAALAGHEVAWVHRRPLATLDIAPDLDRLLAVHAHMRTHTRPGIHLREIDVANVDSKFIEGHRELLAEWLDLSLPAHAIDRAHSGVRGFARRYGYRDKPLRLRFRSLDPACPLIALAGDAVSADPAPTDPTPVGLALADLTLDATSAAHLRPAHRRVVITENEVNFLTLPPLPDTLALFGAGYGFNALAALGWLDTREILYWGDLDTHGFAILDELRGVLPHTRSVLMDRDTLLAHRASWGVEPKPRHATLSRLDATEARLYTELVDGVHGDRVRLEQERIGHGWVVRRLRTATSPPSRHLRP